MMTSFSLRKENDIILMQAMSIHEKTNITPQVERKKNIVMNEKPQKCMCMSNVLAFLSKPERTY